jgi:hypothetical protein
MVRVVLTELAIFFLPVILYAAYIAVRKSADGEPIGWSIFDELPLLPLFLAGTILVLGVIIYFASQSEPNTGKTYEPPRYEDGKVIPGRIK